MKEKTSRKSRKKDYLILFAVGMAITYLALYLFSSLNQPKTFQQESIEDLADIDNDGYIYPGETNYRSGEYQYDFDAVNHFMLAWAEAMKNKDYNLYFTLLSKSTKLVIIVENNPGLLTGADPVAEYMKNPSKYDDYVRQVIRETFENMGSSGIESFKVISAERLESTEEERKEGIDGYLSVEIIKEYDDGTGEETSVQLIIEDEQLKL